MQKINFYLPYAEKLEKSFRFFQNVISKYLILNGRLISIKFNLLTSSQFLAQDKSKFYDHKFKNL